MAKQHRKREAQKRNLHKTTGSGLIISFRDRQIIPCAGLFIITQDFRATKMGKRPHSNKSALVIGKSMYEQVNYEIFTDQPSGTPNCFGLVCSSDDNPMVVRYFT